MVRNNLKTRNIGGHMDRSVREDAGDSRSLNRGLCAKFKHGLLNVLKANRSPRPSTPVVQTDTETDTETETGGFESVVPNDVPRCIFVLIVEGCDPLTFPFPRNEFPAQLTLSHVCSRWRMVARHTFELWKNIRLTFQGLGYYIGQPIQEWVLLAGNSTITLTLQSIHFIDNYDKLASIIQNTVSPFKAKILHLHVTISELMALSKLPNSVLPDIGDLWLEVSNKDISKKFSVTPHIFARLRSVIFCGWPDVPNTWTSVPLPWSQLRCLGFNFDLHHLAPVFGILEQIPTLQDLQLKIVLHHNCVLDSLKKLTMPCLRNIYLRVTKGDLDNILLRFTCPALTVLTLTGSALWTNETFEIIKQQYNMQRLRKIKFERCPLPVSSILRDAPLLRRLYLTNCTTNMDDDAITGISIGTLGVFFGNSTSTIAL